MSADERHDPASDGFLGRWARRKEAARRSEEAAPQAGETPAAGVTPWPDSDIDPDPDAEIAPADERVLTDADMPDIDSLQPDSDVSDFFSPGVSEALRRKALRKLFHASRFNVKDGLDDYDDDYTLLQPLGNTSTWDLRRQQERLAERRERKAAEAQSEAQTESQSEPGAEPAPDAAADTEPPADTNTSADRPQPDGSPDRDEENNDRA